MYDVSLCDSSFGKPHRAKEMGPGLLITHQEMEVNDIHLHIQWHESVECLDAGLQYHHVTQNYALLLLQTTCRGNHLRHRHMHKHYQNLMSHYYAIK